MRKPTKTISGVTPLAAVIKPKKCKHGTCLYCPSLNVPQSYTPKSPAIMRASLLNYDPYKQVKARLKAFQAMKHPTDKIELIILGGTFLEYPKTYQYKFIKSCYDALNNKISKTLEQAKKLNEKAKHRCIALCIETRPDVCSKEDIKRILDFGCTRVELGVQTLDNKIYKKINRGHLVKDVIKATQLLKDSGFKVSYHFMPSLPSSNFKKDLKIFKKLFSDERFKPDQLKIYPCQVIKGSKLEKLFYKNKYKTYSIEELIKLLLEFKKIVPRYCRIMRIMREIPPDFIIAGTKRIDLRNILEKELKKRNLKCKCIRCREVGHALRKGIKINKKLKLNKIIYKASKGKEIFLEYINKDNILFGILRLRFPYKPFIKELKNSAIVRELHIYGKSLPLGKLGEKGEFQHKGLGKKLMKKAEYLAKKEGYKKLAVISGIGVREYYKKLNYKLEGNYMIKYL